MRFCGNERRRRPEDRERLLRSFFGADAAALLKRLRRIETAVDCVLFIAHNPGLEDLAAGICGDGPEPMRRRMSGKFPTAALAAFTIDAARWSSLREGAAILSDFVLLKDLAQVRRKPREAR
ncbi:MAG: hypothetical protein OXL41_13760 [Nitrospinae bacterium]|nr:hypothetical protein [Nitrospinota bacterium]